MRPMHRPLVAGCSQEQSSLNILGWSDCHVKTKKYHYMKFSTVVSVLLCSSGHYDDCFNELFHAVQPGEL